MTQDKALWNTILAGGAATAENPSEDQVDVSHSYGSGARVPLLSMNI